MNSDSERTNGQLPEKNSGECAEKACENADDRDFGSEFVSDEILCGETEAGCRNGGKIVIAAQKNGGRLLARLRFLFFRKKAYYCVCQKFGGILCFLKGVSRCADFYKQKPGR